MQEWPLKSELDPKEYGPPESVISTKCVEEVIRGFMTVDEVLMSLKTVTVVFWCPKPIDLL